MKEKVGKVLGWIPLLGSLGIAIGYSAIIGWVLRFLWGSVTNTVLEQDAAEYFCSRLLLTWVMYHGMCL